MLVGQQTTQQMLPWTFQAGVNVDVTPNIEIGTELRYWLYRQYKNQHTDIVGIFLLRELDTEKDYHDSQEWTGGVRVHDLAAAPKLDLMMGGQYDHSPAPPRSITLDSPSFSHFGCTPVRATRSVAIGSACSYIHYWYEVPTITDSITMPPSNIRGSGSNNIFTLSLEAHLMIPEHGRSTDEILARARGARRRRHRLARRSRVLARLSRGRAARGL